MKICKTSKCGWKLCMHCSCRYEQYRYLGGEAIFCHSNCSYCLFMISWFGAYPWLIYMFISSILVLLCFRVISREYHIYISICTRHDYLSSVKGTYICEGFPCPCVWIKFLNLKVPTRISNFYVFSYQLLKLNWIDC